MKRLFMSAFKQIILLLILLIAFISFVTKYHLDTFVLKKQDNQEIEIVEKVTKKKIEKELINNEEKIVEQIKEEITPKKDDIKKEIKSTTTKKINEKTSAVKKITTITKEDIKAVSNQVSKKVKKEPTVTTDNLVTKVVKKEYKLSQKNMQFQYEINEIIKKNRIIFKRLSTDVTQDSLEVLQEVASFLIEHNIKIEVAGHTDAKGEEKVNEYISEQRAKSVKKELIKLGVLGTNIVAKGYGEIYPIVKNNKLGYSQINRRVEFNIIEEQI